MRRYTAGTPCPPPNLSFPGNHYPHEYGRRSSIYAPGDDTTSNIEYTTALQPHLRQAKPRRPMRSMRQSTFNPSLDIFEDVAQEEEQQRQQHRKQRPEVETKRRSRASIMPEGAGLGRSTILANPAQRIPKPVSQLDKPHRRRVSQLLVDRQDHDMNATVQLREDVLEKKELRKQGPKKDPRRRTIYIPSDDTTMFTIHPGQGSQASSQVSTHVSSRVSSHVSRNPRQQSPDIGLDLVTLSEEEGNNLEPALKKEKRLPRKSLAMPPKRGPLSTSGRSYQSSCSSVDVIGQGGGKENMPPGMEIIESKSHGTTIEFNFSKIGHGKPVSKAPKVHFNATKEPESAPQSRKRSEVSQKRVRPHVSHDDPPSKSIKARADGTASAAGSRAALRTTIKTERARMSKANRIAQASSSPFHTDKSPPTALRRQKTDHAPPSITMMHIVGQPVQAREKYPVLAEDLARPELYEDNWLTYQEVAITQLINSVFTSSNKDANAEIGAQDLRKKMLGLYHDPSIPMLHKRLQASLQYGALGISKDLLAQTLRLKDDVGLRKKFLNLWTKSYDLCALRAAVETIIGRQITTPCRLSTGSTSSDDGSRTIRAERRAIEGFLDAFLIKNEDAVRVKAGIGSIASLTRGEDDFGSQAWSWRRTALRSLMLILLLDQAKRTDVLPGCLFQSTSPFKTSTEILHQLSNLLLPSLGDITRPLGHLSYKVEHAQYPLQEYTYHIDNIAIDLRDGIMLTRLVELLLYSPTTLAEQREDTVNITMPSGELLTSSFDMAQKDSWVLSQHLKYPAIGRPQRVYNAQIALAALGALPELSTISTGDIKAEDIVDGHREKTLSLLWTLVGKCGFGTLVEWPQLAKETERFREQWYKTRDNFRQRELDSDSEDDTIAHHGLQHHKRLLLCWSRSIARLHGIAITNLTTSFADPKAFEAIVDTYLPSTLSNTALGLAAKLKAVGCSTSFIALFSPQHSSARSIPSRDFTLLTLAFLASRLLPLSRSHRAASTIQRAFRTHRLRRTTSQRIRALVVAHNCQVVAQARQKLVDAATVLQMRWRYVLDARNKQLESDVLAFQALARGWAIRRWVRRITAGRVGGKEKVRRAVGGW